MSKPPATSGEFMPQRLMPTENVADVDTRKLQGRWVYQTPEYAMTLTLVEDKFEWIVVFGDIQEAQFFARGNFRVIGDVVVFGVRPDLGVPRDPSKPWMKYMPMSIKDLNFKIQLGNNRAVWTVPASEQKKVVAQSSRIFIGHEDGLFEWIKK